MSYHIKDFARRCDSRPRQPYSCATNVSTNDLSDDNNVVTSPSMYRMVMQPQSVAELLGDALLLIWRFRKGHWFLSKLYNYATQTERMSFEMVLCATRKSYIREL
ncbi:hypothetical protein DPMN_131212 [Dreissena polymorpha]|uniref:Uncharacterized protein n=1 Tax=Dreissena polymorpha TaxID=45954 RepID=A0A9D4K283_DREPO|nr:hypothetical protein DPMN_131212 [Dreissena polymorpha]